MLDYLMGSGARHRLLICLWRDQGRGSIRSLALRTKTSFSVAHAELHKMQAAGLAVCEKVAGAFVYAANTAHPLASELKKLAGYEPPEPDYGASDRTSSESARAALAELGAPLYGRAPVGELPGNCEQTLVDGLLLSHTDPTVARVMPVCLWQQRDRLDIEALKRLATQQGQKQTLGFFLAVTAHLSGDRTLAAHAESLRDRRIHRARDFFVGAPGPYARKVAQRNTPPLARDWHFIINMGMDSFAAVFSKHTSDATLPAA